MSHGVQVTVLWAYVVWLLSRGEAAPRLGNRQRDWSAIWGAVIPVYFGAGVLIMPLVLLDDRQLAEFVGPAHEAVLALVLGVPALVAYGLVRLVAPHRLKRKRLLLIARAAGLVGVLLAVDELALHSGVPVLTSAAMISISLIVTPAYMAFWRSVDRGYWPTLLVRDGLATAAAAGFIGFTFLSEGRSLMAAAGQWPDYVEALELGALAVIAVAQVGVGVVRRARWLDNGPSASLAPPGVRSWPPSGGEVWSAFCTHEDGNYKDRPVLVLYSDPEAAYVLRFTSQNKAGSRFHLPLRLDDWAGVLTKVGFLELEIKPVPYCDFRLYRGSCTERFWNGLVRNNKVREPQLDPLPITFTRRQRIASAKNQHLGRKDGLIPPRRTEPAAANAHGRRAHHR